MTLLFITQKLHGQDAFGAQWVDEFRRQGYSVTVLCLEQHGECSFPVVSMGKEKGFGRVRCIINFWKHIIALRYDRVFIHMSPVWGLLGAPVFIPRRTPTYLWYTHYQMSLSLLVTASYAKRLFCATTQSLPQYARNPKKVVTGHGIDLAAWPKRRNACTDPHRLLAVHRLSRSKRLELIITALKELPEYSLDVYGIEAEPKYVRELHALVGTLQLAQRVRFHGTVPMTDLPEIYVQHRLIVNMAGETIDKTMLEAMTCGCYPMTTKRNAEAIGIPEGVEADTVKAIADFIRRYGARAPLSAEQMYDVVVQRHGLQNLVKTMSVYISDGC